MASALPDLGFPFSYEVEINPEFAPSDDSRELEIRVGGHTADMLAFRVSPGEGEPWVGLFGCERQGLLVGLFPCPNPDHLVVVTGTDAYLIPVRQPNGLRELPIHPITAAGRPSGTDLLVIGSFTALAAIDAVGLLWMTDRLFTDDLELAAGTSGKVYVQGSVHSIPSDPDVLTIDPASGKVVAGELYSSMAIGHRSSWWHRDAS